MEAHGKKSGQGENGGTGGTVAGAGNTGGGTGNTGATDIRMLRNSYGKGALNAIRTGLESASDEWCLVCIAYNLRRLPDETTSFLSETPRPEFSPTGC